MSAASFMTARVTILRNEDLGDGRTGEPAEYLDDLPMTPLWPVGTETINLLELNSPREFKECFHTVEAGEDLPDIREGDILETEAGEQFPVAAVNEWIDDDIPTLHLVVQQVKGL